jgi:nucleoside-diphosphate-sugar epimerase
VCDKHHPTFGELEASIAKQLGKKAPISIPYWLAKCAAIVGDIIGDKFPLNSARLEKMTTESTFSSAKAQKELGWEPLDVLEHYEI